jgi:hypothetical protein
VVGVIVIGPKPEPTAFKPAEAIDVHVSGLPTSACQLKVAEGQVGLVYVNVAV